MANSTAADLADLPLHSLLSGPLIAAVEAQQETARHMVEFIQEVGFVREDNRTRARMVGFAFTQMHIGPQGREEEREVTLEIPLLLLIPTPSLEIEELTVDFLAKIRHVESGTGEEKKQAGRSHFAAKYPFLGHPARLRVRPTARKKEETEKTTSSYDLEVSLTARAQESPEGIERLMNGLTGLMRETAQER